MSNEYNETGKLNVFSFVLNICFPNNCDLTVSMSDEIQLCFLDT